MLRLEKLNEDPELREKIILEIEKILKEKQGKDKAKSSKGDRLEKSIDEIRYFDILTDFT